MGVREKKYENTILYICEKLGGQIEGKKKLAKLLYYVDFDRYEYNESMLTVTGDTFKAWKMGPVPNHYVDVINKLIEDEKLSRFQIETAPGYSPTEVFRCASAPDTSVFDKDDLLIIDRVIRKYGELTGKQLEVLTHQEAPYIGTERDEQIPFELAFYRGTDFSDVL
jgi:uncharacterized phage-associated protein